MAKDKLQKLFATPRMSHGAVENSNSVVGLYEMIKQYFKPDFEMVEVGSFEGTSTLVFAMFVKKVYSVDNYDYVVPPTGRIPSHDQLFVRAEKAFIKRTSKVKNIIKIKKSSLDAARDFADESLDAVYIDAEHDENSIRNDIQAWKGKVKKGGILSGHDFWLPYMQNILVDNGFTSATIYSDFSWAISL